MTSPRQVAVAMSGGVDSSVAAALLVEQGQPAFGLMLRLWSAGPELPNRCCSPRDMAMARRVADQLGISFYVLDVRERFHTQVVQFFVDGYAQGITPNPCMECNRSIRWQFLLEHALGLGATHLATGHYARVEQDQDRFHLLRAADRAKDQSYVLSVLGQAQLSHALFPLGNLTKPEVRAAARRLDLPVADRPGHVLSHAVSSAKIREATGWRPAHRFNEGVQEAVAWYSQHPAWWRSTILGQAREYFANRYPKLVEAVASQAT